MARRLASAASSFARFFLERDFAVPLFLFARQIAPDIDDFAFLLLADQGDLALPFFQFDGQLALDLGGFLLRAFVDDRRFLLDLRRLVGARFLEFFLLHGPALFDDEALGLAHRLGLFVGDFAFLVGRREGLLLVQIQQVQLGGQAQLAGFQRRPFSGLVPLDPARFFLGGHGGRLGNIGFLAFDFLMDQADLLVLLGFLARQRAVDLGQLFFLGLGDDRDFLVAAFLLQFQGFLDFRRLALLGFLRDRQFALGAHLLELDLVADLPLFHRLALVEDEHLLLAHLQGFFVGDRLVLVGAGGRFLTLDLQQFELRVQILLADRDRGAFLGVVNHAPRFAGDRRDDLQAFGVEHIIRLEMLLAGLFQDHDRDFLQGQSVGSETLGHVGLDRFGHRLAVFVQFLQRFGGGIAAQGADNLRFQQVAHFLRIEGLFAQAPAGSQQFLLGAADMGVELRCDVDTDVVVGQDRLVARPADDQLDRLQRYPGHLVEHRQDDRAAAQAHLGAEEAGADEAHVRRRALIHPDRQDVDDRDDDDR